MAREGAIEISTCGRSGPSRRQRALAWGFVTLGLAAMVWFGVHRVLTRHFNVDEFENTFNTYLLICRRRPALANPLEPYLILLRLPFGCPATTAGALFRYRLAFLAALVGSFAAIALIQDAHRSPLGRAAVFLAIGFSPQMWRHGFEIRHDVVVLLCGLFLLYVAMRAAEDIRASHYFCAGVVFISGTLASYKAPVLLAPLVGIAILNEKLRRRALFRPMLLVTVGVLVGLLPWILLLSLDSALAAYVEHWREFFSYATRALGPHLAGGFHASPLILALLVEKPISGLLFLIAVVGTFGEWVRSGSNLPTRARTLALASCVALMAIALNPVPYPYNATWLYPFLFMPALYAHVYLGGGGWIRNGLLGVLVAESVLCLMFPNAYDVTSNQAQLETIATAEALTSPNDPILDGAGLVPTRPPSGDSWLLHPLLRAEYDAGKQESVREVVSRDAPPVLIRNYRTDSLNKADREALIAAYVSVGGPISVLGGAQDAASGEFVVRRTGRYSLTCGLGDGSTLRVDGFPTPRTRPLKLSEGTHHFECDRGPFAFTWVGPRFSAPPHLRGPAIFPFTFDSPL